MKKFILFKISFLFILLLEATCLFAKSAKNSESTCPPTCKGETAYVFSTSFCCQKITDSVKCKHYGINNIKGRNYQCDVMDSVSVYYYDPHTHSPFSTSEETQKDYYNPPFTTLTGVSETNNKMKMTYDCPAKDISMYLEYNSDDASINASVYHKDTNTVMLLDTYLEYNLDPNSSLVQQTVGNFRHYLCEHWDPMQFFRTYQAYPFSFPNRRKPKTSSTTTAKPTSESSDAGSDTQQTSIKDTTKNNAWHVLGEDFYVRPKNAAKPNTVQFISADKRKNLYIRFSNKKKSLYLQNLEKKHAKTKHATTVCQNGSTLFEMNDKTYKAYILSDNAVSILTTPPAKIPASTTKQNMLCAFPATEAKKF